MKIHVILFVALFARAVMAASAGDLTAADHLRLSKKWDAAISAYGAIADADPSNGKARYGMVLSLLGARRFDEARTVAEQLHASPANAALGEVALADVYFRTAQFSKAGDTYAAAIKADPTQARGWLGWGRLLEVASMRKRAIEPLQKAYALDPQDVDILHFYASTIKNHVERIPFVERYIAAIEPYDAERAQGAGSYLAILKELGDKRGSELKSPYVRSEVPLELLRPDPRSVRGWAINVSVNGSKPQKLLLDTGASGITINRKFAEKVNLELLHKQEIKGIGDEGAMGASIALAREVRIGEVVLANCPIDVSDKKSVADETGIIGTDVLDDFVITLDPFARKIILDPLPGRDRPPTGINDREPLPPGFTHFLRFGHLMLLSTEAGSEPPAMFLVDTGANSTLVDRSFAKKLTNVNRTEATMKGVSGKVKDVFIADHLELSFAGLRYPTGRVYSMDLGKLNDDVGTEVSGILGFELLSRLITTIDYADGCIRFVYRH